MDNTLTKVFIEQTLKSTGSCSLKRFMADPNNFKSRTIESGRVLSKNTGVYFAEYIYHEYLSRQTKDEFFESSYEIGHPNPIDTNSEKEFFNYLRNKYGGGDVADLVKSIKKYITSVTGIPFSEFIKSDRSLAYKVITLFYRICRCNSPRFLTFLNDYKDLNGKARFEFRTTYPYTDERAQFNTALLADLLCHLTFSMPEKELKQAQVLNENVANCADEITDYIKQILESKVTFIRAPLVDDIYSLIDKLLPITEKKSKENRLDFLLFTHICLSEYLARAKSNRLVEKHIYDNPLKLTPLRNAVLPTFEDFDVLSFLFDKPITHVPSNLEIQARFLEHIIIYKDLKSGKLPKMNFQILKAIILHDQKLKIAIPSKIAGTDNIPKSVTSTLKGAVTYFNKNGKFPPLNYYPEAIIQFWYFRYKFANRILLEKTPQNIRIEILKSISELDQALDERLVSYLLNKTVEDYNEIELLPDMFFNKLNENS